MSNLPPPPPPPPPGRGRKRPDESGERRQPDRSSNKKSGDESDADGTAATGRGPGSWPRWTIWVLIGVLAAAFLVPSLWPSDSGESLEYSEWRTQVIEGNIDTATIQNGSGRITGTFTNGDKYTTTGDGSTGVSDDDRALLIENGVDYDFEPESNNWLLGILSIFLPVMLIIGFFVWLQRRAQGQMGGVMSIGKSKAKAYDSSRPSTTFDDIAGYEGVKQEISEVVDFLRYPERFAEIGARVPKGMLLVGPPGTGKTLFARAVAGEAGVGFFSVTGSDFMEMFVGVGASRVRDLFQQARRMGKAIIFVDEIDSIGRKRGAGLGGGHDEREQTLNQLLAELDGFEPSENVIVMGATNRPDILDKALLRPGRFDRQISVDLPSQNSRHEILKIHARNKSIDESVDLKKIASSTPGFSGADLENLLNEASLYAGRNKRNKIIMEDIENARDKIMMGLEREGMQIDDEEKRILAYHEAGHAIVAAALPKSDPLHKVSVIPRGKAMGITMQLPEKEKYLYNKEYLLDRMAVIMGGRAAEQLIFNTATSGAQNDLMRVAKLSRKMVVEWGMSEKFGHLAFGSDEEDVFLGRDMTRQKSYSDSTAREIDQEVQAISREAYDRAIDILKENRDAFDKLAELLIKKEEVSGDEVLSLMGKKKDENEED